MGVQSLLRNLCPLIFLVLLLSRFILAACNTRPKTSPVRKGRWMKPLVIGIIFTYVVEGIVLAIVATKVTQDHVTYLLSMVLLWAIAASLLAKAGWYYRTIAALFACGFDLALTVLDTHTSTPAARCMLSFRIIRAVLLIGLACSPALSKTYRPSTDAENQPLLEDGAAKDQDTEDDSEDYAHYTKKKLKERKEASGNWLEYVKAYKVFVPLVVPKRNLKLQVCLLVTLIILLIERVLVLLVPRQLGVITDSLANNHHHFPLREILIWMLLLLLNSRAGLTVAQNFVERPLEQFQYRSITQAAFNHLMTLSIDFHNDSDSAELIQAVNQGHGLGNILQMFATQILPEVIDMVIGYVYFYHLFGVYVLYIVTTAALAYSYITIKSANWLQDYRRENARLSRKESTVINQAIQGWQTISFFNRFTLESSRVRDAIAALQTADWHTFWRSNLARMLKTLIFDVAFFGVSFIAIYKISRDEIPIGTFIVLVNYWDSLMYPLQGLTFYYTYIQSQLIDAERLLLLLQTKPSVIDRENASELRLTAGAVAFDNVHFSYDPRKPTISNVSFEAQPGQTVAFVGETGGGKSTMLKLLYRFYDVTEGGIYIDGQNIRDVTLHSLREALGIVDQSPYLSNVSIADNLRYAKLDATDEELHAACRAAAIHDKVLSFPDGYASVVGQRGVKLSGGELQRIAIARVLLKDPKIVLLDEATSAVDTDTEALIQKALKGLSKGRTTFVIAHRLSTILSADLVLVVQEGRIIERGTHQELLRLGGGKYRSLWSKQVAATLEGGEGGEVDGVARKVGEVVVDDLLVALDGKGGGGVEGDGNGDDVKGNGHGN